MNPWKPRRTFNVLILWKEFCWIMTIKIWISTKLWQIKCGFSPSVERPYRIASLDWQCSSNLYIFTCPYLPISEYKILFIKSRRWKSFLVFKGSSNTSLLPTNVIYQVLYLTMKIFVEITISRFSEIIFCNFNKSTCTSKFL
jgi:hypothetical protein